jgi:predicted metal-dependent hydrolase
MKKNNLLEAWLDSWEAADTPAPSGPAQTQRFPREYRAFFHCFNTTRFYEAHDVLEHLWLRCTGADRSFYQALIQLAGAFVHFQKQAQFPAHPTHARRGAPGGRLLGLAKNRLAAFPDWHLGVDVAALRLLCTLWEARAAEGIRPLQCFAPPRLDAPAGQP